MSQQINLFNPAFVRRQEHFSLATMLQGLGLILLGSVFLYGYAAYQVDQLSRQREAGEQQVNDGQLKLARFAEEYSPQRSDQMLQAEVRRLEGLVSEQGDLVQVMNSGALGNSEGYSEYMRAFSRQLVKGLWLTGFNVSEDGAQVSLSGGVMNPGLLPEYIQRLRREHVMQGKTFAALQMRQAAPGKSGVASRHVEFVLHSSTEESKK